MTVCRCCSCSGTGFENLEATFTVHFEAWKGDWGLFADVSWLDLGGEMSTPDPEVTIGVDFEQTLLEAGVAYDASQGGPLVALRFFW